MGHDELSENDCGCKPYIEDCEPESEAEDCICSCHSITISNFHRASGDQLCYRCQKPYRKHPRGGRRGMGGERFLRRLCDGDLVKL